MFIPKQSGPFKIMGPIACERKIYAENHANYKQPKKHLFPDRVGWKVSQLQNGFQSMSKTKGRTKGQMKAHQFEPTQDLTKIKW